MTVAALYVDPRGPYPKLLGPELCWDEQRDARTYAGPGPVVAHPPCGPWGRLRHLYRGSEHDCAPRAVEQVRQFGGVLEHPAGSKVWDEPCGPTLPSEWPECTLPLPGEEADPWGGFTVEVDQVEWGHVARKRTWLYVVGIPREVVGAAIERRPLPGREPTHWLSGGRTKSSRQGSPVPPGIKVCSAQQRRRTPVAFAEWLISLVEQAGQNRRAAE